MRLTLTWWLGHAAFSGKQAKARYNKMQTLELPCSVCEFTGLINRMQKDTQMPATTEKDCIIHILERIPGDEAQLGALRKSMVGMLYGDRTTAHTGRDEARCASMGYKYLKRHRDPVPDSAHDQHKAKKLKLTLLLLLPV